jgi:hypothetical protein
MEMLRLSYSAPHRQKPEGRVKDIVARPSASQEEPPEFREISDEQLMEYQRAHREFSNDFGPGCNLPPEYRWDEIETVPVELLAEIRESCK